LIFFKNSNYPSLSARPCDEAAEPERPRDGSEAAGKRTRAAAASEEGGDGDWDFLLGDESVRGLGEFGLGRWEKGARGQDARPCEFRLPASGLRTAKLERVSRDFGATSSYCPFKINKI
jgi:hypothetical protein